MDKDEHGRRLSRAMAERRTDRGAVAAAADVKPRTVTNWKIGASMPGEQERAVLRRMFPGYDDPGDPVEVAILHCELTEDRQHTLIGTYKRLLREQSEGTRDVG